MGGIPGEPLDKRGDTVNRRIPASFPCLLAPVLFVLGCGSGETVEPDPGPADLTGSYTLVSFTSALTGGQPVGPPEVSGEFTLRQTAVNGDEATGTMAISMVLPPGSPLEQVEDSGTYKNRTDGTWEQMAQGLLGQAIGTFTFTNGRLTVNATEPALAVSTTVWQRQ